MSVQFEQKDPCIEEQNNSHVETNQISVSDDESTDDTPKSGWKSLIKKVAVTTGKGVVKGVKKIADTSKKSIQIRRWKEDILRRMTMGQLKRLCFEKKISTKKNVLKEDGRSGELYWKEYDCTKNDLVSRLKNKMPLDDIISYAKRIHINIRDILHEIEHKKAEWKVKELSEKIDDIGSNLFLELEKAIREFAPMRRYDKEIYYQDSLASWLKSKFPDTRIEVPRGSTRPDIVVEGVAIEVKGPTYDTDLQTIADKCLRYTQYYSQGFICVLFCVYVNQQRYIDWENGMNKIFPDVKIIRI